MQLCGREHFIELNDLHQTDESTMQMHHMQTLKHLQAKHQPWEREREREKGIAGECIIFFLLLKAPLNALQMGTTKQNILTKSVAYTISIRYAEIPFFIIICADQTYTTIQKYRISRFLFFYVYLNISTMPVKLSSKPSLAPSLSNWTLRLELQTVSFHHQDCYSFNLCHHRVAPEHAAPFWIIKT